MKQDERDKTVIGWREYVNLPSWGLNRVRAKADTGARSTAIDVSHVEELPGDRVRFEVVASRGKVDRRVVIEADVVRRGHVRSSLGRGEDRLFVETELEVAGRHLRTQIGLVNRENMLSRMLLGRRTLDDAFLVDSSRTYIHGQRRRRQTQEDSA